MAVAARVVADVVDRLLHSESAKLAISHQAHDWRNGHLVVYGDPGCNVALVFA